MKWTFPGDVVKEGTVVKYGLGTVGTQTVKLNATIDGNARSWTLEVEIREYVIYSTDWAQDGSNYNGFKGTCPVFSPDGKTVYIITFNKVSALYAFDVVTGNEKWRYLPTSKSGSYNMLTVNPVTGDIYYGTTSAGQFYAITPEGELKWIFSEAGSMKSAAPAVNANGTVVYICDALGKAFAIDAASGQKKWQFSAGDAGRGLLVNGSELLIGTQTDAFFVNIETGEQIAKVTLGCEMSDITGFAVNSDKTLAYFGGRNGYIGAVNIKTHEAIKSLVVEKDNPNHLYEPVVAPNGSVFAGSKNGSVYNVKGDLSAVNWEYVHTGSSSPTPSITPTRASTAKTASTSLRDRPLTRPTSSMPAATWLILGPTRAATTTRSRWAATTISTESFIRLSSAAQARTAFSSANTSAANAHRAGVPMAATFVDRAASNN